MLRINDQGHGGHNDRPIDCRKSIDFFLASTSKWPGFNKLTTIEKMTNSLGFVSVGGGVRASHATGHN